MKTSATFCPKPTTTFKNSWVIHLAERMNMSYGLGRNGLSRQFFVAFTPNSYS